MTIAAEAVARWSSHDFFMNSPVTMTKQNTPSSAKVTGDDDDQRRAAGSRARPYPLDLPGLSFERYEHRRLGVCEVLVSRVVADLMGPIRAVQQGAQILDMSSASRCTFIPEITLDVEERGPELDLELDLGLLEDMAHLVPSDDPLRHVPLKRLRGKETHQREVDGTTTALQKPWTVGERILDLVQRHYIEVDEAATRQWFRTMRFPQGPLQPFRPTAPTAGALADPTRTVSATPRTKPRRGTRAAALQSYEARRNHSRLEDRGGMQQQQHHVLDLLKHRKSLERFAKTQDGLRLYDGGATRPWNIQALDFSRSITAHQISVIGHESITPLWPHSQVLRRFKIRVAWKHRRKLKDPLFVTAHPPFSPARGRGPFKYYAQNSKRPTTFNHPDDPARRRRRRERSLSEPPPGMFAYARLPRPAHHGPLIDMEIAYPRLSLSQIDRRSRRRSLDRENIKDMFGGASIRGAGILSKSLGDEQKDHLEAEDGGSCTIGGGGGLQDPCPSKVQGRRLGSGKGPMIVQRGVWCGICDAFHLLSDLHNLVVDSGPVQTMYRSQEVGSVMSSYLAREKERSRMARSWQDTMQSTEDPYSFPCSNCTDEGHTQTFCLLRCGHCGALGADVNPRDPIRPTFQLIRTPPPGLPARYHKADDCKVPKRNRCKCVSFPTFHTAKDCTITCSRPCGNPWPPGHFRHRNAMTCKYRCCMCGLRGHAGKDCNLTKDSCFCGKHHLGQDCGWKPRTFTRVSS